MNRLTNAIKTCARRMGALSAHCKEAARLQSAALDGRLTLLERFSLSCHLALCKWCRRYGRQIRFLRVAAQDDNYAPSQRLSPETRERIKQRLQSEKE